MIPGAAAAGACVAHARTAIRHDADLVQDEGLGAAVVAPSFPDDLNGATCDAFAGAAFIWHPDIEAFTQAGRDRQVAAASPGGSSGSDTTVLAQ